MRPEANATVFCTACGGQMTTTDRFCRKCGAALSHGNSSRSQEQGVASVPLSPSAQTILETGSRSQRSSGVVLVLSALGLFVLIGIILALVLPSGNSQSEARDQSMPSTQPSAALSTPSEKPHDPPVQKAVTRENKEADAAALRAVREEWIKNAQQELWRQGMEMKVQARGTTLYVEYVLAGDAFAFQFGETFLGKNGATLKALGFKKVYLSNGEGGWTWDLSRY